MSCGYIARQPSSTGSDNTRSYLSASQKPPRRIYTQSNMSSPQSTTSERPAQPYMLVPNLHVTDPSAREVDLGSHPWMIATVIEDDDLTFGGKPLSAWYEEERRRLSIGHDEEEETRGRQRERAWIDSHHHHHHHHHHQHHHHHHHPPHHHHHKPQQQQHQHSKKTKDAKQ